MSLFQTFSYLLSTISSSDEEKKGEVAASFLSYLLVSLGRTLTLSQLKVQSASNFWYFYLICDNFCSVFLLLSMLMFIVCHQSLFENKSWYVYFPFNFFFYLFFYLFIFFTLVCCTVPVGNFHSISILLLRLDDPHNPCSIFHLFIYSW